MSTALTSRGTIATVETIDTVAKIPNSILNTCRQGIKKAFSLIKEKDKNVIKLIDKSLQETSSCQTLPTPEAMKSKFLEDSKKFEEYLKPIQMDMDEKHSISTAFALKSSGLGHFIQPEQEEVLIKTKKLTKIQTSEMVSQSIDQYKIVTSVYTKDSILSAAREIGFNEKTKVKKTFLGTHIISTNSKGQSITVLFNVSDKGIKLNADTLGFSNGECTKVMNSFLKGLKKYKIELSEIQIKEHWKKQGILDDHIEKKSKELSSTHKKSNAVKNENKKRKLRQRLNNMMKKQRI